MLKRIERIKKYMELDKKIIVDELIRTEDVCGYFQHFIIGMAYSFVIFLFLILAKKIFLG